MSVCGRVVRAGFDEGLFTFSNPSMKEAVTRAKRRPRIALFKFQKERMRNCKRIMKRIGMRLKGIEIRMRNHMCLKSGYLSHSTRQSVPRFSANTAED